MELVKSEIVENIKQKLIEIEQKENVRIIYACESGSRAWGFESEDSDFDVRFVYVRNERDYLRLEEKRDVIESELNDIYDINGWDIQKLLRLLMKSNPTIFEWAASPIIYRTSEDWERVKAILNDYFQIDKTMYHYLSMLKNNVRNYFCSDDIVLKKYLYILRPALALEWIMQHKCPPPMRFSELVAEVLPSELNASVERILEAKKSSKEKEKGHRDKELDYFVQAKTLAAEVYLQSFKREKYATWDALNDVFLSLLGKSVK